MTLHLNDLSVGYPHAVPVVGGVTLDLPDDGVTAILGTNGSGKSTLLKTVARILRPQVGAVLLDGHDIHRIPTRVLARRLAILTQDPTVPEGLTVRELVSYGRSPHRGMWRPLGRDDDAQVDQALVAAAMTDLQDRAVDSLSGGQRQRAWIAMALAQDTPTILLDEPTSFLDVHHQIGVMELLRRLADQRGKRIVMVVHDINQALRYADHVVVLHESRIVAAGRPGTVLTPELIRRVFRVQAVIGTGPDGRPHCIPYALTADASSSRPSLPPAPG